MRSMTQEITALFKTQIGRFGELYYKVEYKAIMLVQHEFAGKFSQARLPPTRPFQDVGQAGENIGLPQPGQLAGSCG